MGVLPLQTGVGRKWVRPKSLSCLGMGNFKSRHLHYA